MLKCKRIICALSGTALAILAAGCGSSDSATPSKPFEPQASVRAVGGTARTDKPLFVIRVEARPGDANIRSAKVTLPPVVFVDPTVIRALCSKSELKADGCKGRQQMGDARAVSPTFDGPLTGPVYAVTGFGGLPRLAYVLGGPAKVVLHGRVVTMGKRIQAGVENVPDTPLKTFEFTIKGGKDSYLILSRDLCANKIEADASFVAQSGETFEQKIPLEADCAS
jgi:hypothetical protein